MNAFPKLAALAIGATLLASPLAARAQTADASLAPRESTLTVNGDATVERAPDRADVSMTIVTNDDAATNSTSKNNTIYAAVKKSMLALGLTNDALATTNFDVTYVPYPPRGLPPEQRQPRYGYVTTRTLRVTAAIDQAGKVIDAGTAAGVTDIGGVAFSLKDRASAYNAALAAALVNARTSANALAAGGAFSIVKIRSVGTGSDFIPQPAYARFAAAKMDAAPAPTEIAPAGPIEIKGHVDVVYVIR